MYSDALLKLEKNSVDIYKETTRILLKIAENILQSPENLKIRTLQLNNETVTKNIVNVPGAIECLHFMGFQQSKTTLILPNNESLKNLELMKYELLKRKASSKGISIVNGSTNRVEHENDLFQRVILPPLKHMYNNIFLKTMEDRFHKVLQHENKDLQLRARNLLPLKQLENNAQNRMRDLQQDVKRSKDTLKNDIEIQDIMILEMLNWFKHEFFEWVDCLDCENCGGKSETAGTSHDIDLLAYADRVEVHKCTDCGHFTHFSRFNDLNILLETRRGRCGEWANTFMLFCRALNWDTRFVHDEHDHVWIEVFSHGQNRWLHCDPCEAACDTPLIYETGWRKEITYVIAYSCEEVQDVTWRYSSNHATVLKRRNVCSEADLVNAVMRMRTMRQNSLSEGRRKYLVKRCLTELVELMTERHPTDKDNHGRLSGSVDWKRSRNEIKELDAIPYVWTFSTDHLKALKILFRYSVSLDKYELNSGNVKDIKRNWHSGVFTTEGIFRKEEKDWNAVYISNKEDSSCGFLTWKFEIADTSYVFDEVDIELGYKLFEDGTIDIKLASSTQSVTLKPDDLPNHRNLFCGDTSITLTATLVGGKSWQHAQLFRQTMEDEDFPFTIQFNFKKKSNLNLNLKNIGFNGLLDNGKGKGRRLVRMDKVCQVFKGNFEQNLVEIVKLQIKKASKNGTSL